MKHIFYVCSNVSESLGLERILMFYNLIGQENTDSVHDYENAGGNIIISPDFSSKNIEDFVTDLSYSEKPYIYTTSSHAAVKFSQLYDWNIESIKFADYSSSLTEVIVFNTYKKHENKIFGNIHSFYIKNQENYQIEVIDWNKDYIDKVEKLMKNIEIEDGYSTVECVIKDDELNILRIIPATLSSGIETYTRAQIMNNESPFVLHEIYEDVAYEDKVSFHEDFSHENPISQKRTYNISQINIRCKYETVIKNDLAGGVWKYGGDNTGKTEKICIAIYEIDEEGDKTLCLLHRGYSIYDIEGKEGFVINTREKNTHIKSGDTFFSLKIPSTAIDSSGNLYGWVNEVINAVITIQTK